MFWPASDNLSKQFGVVEAAGGNDVLSFADVPSSHLGEVSLATLDPLLIGRQFDG